jgi:hypothetical protein
MKLLRILNLATLAGIVGFAAGVVWAARHIIGFEQIDLIDLTKEPELTDEDIASWLESGGEQ